MVRVWVALWLAAFCVLSAAAEERLALVVANSDYSASVGRLANPQNDAGLVATALERIGFEVTTVGNRDLRGLRRAVRDHKNRINAAGADTVSFFYYSGHGAADAEADANFLIPIGAEIERPNDLPIEALGVTEIVAAFSGARHNFVAIDACRDYPFRYAGSKTTRKGFLVEQEQRGTLIAFATSPGDVAYDEGSDGGPYARALSAALIAPGADHLDVFKDVQDRVDRETSGRQFPWFRDGIRGRFKFSDAVSTPAATLPPANLDAEIETWLEAVDCADYRRYLNAYPKGRFKARAQLLLSSSACAPAETSSPAKPASETRTVKPLDEKMFESEVGVSLARAVDRNKAWRAIFLEKARSAPSKYNDVGAGTILSVETRPASQAEMIGPRKCTLYDNMITPESYRTERSPIQYSFFAQGTFPCKIEWRGDALHLSKGAGQPLEADLFRASNGLYVFKTTYMSPGGDWWILEATPRGSLLAMPARPAKSGDYDRENVGTKPILIFRE